MSIVRPDRINVKGGKGFSRSGIANVTKPMPAKSVAPAIATKGLTKKLMAMDKKAPFGNKFFLGQAPQQFGQFPKVRKKPMKKTASIKETLRKILKLGLNTADGAFSSLTAPVHTYKRMKDHYKRVGGGGLKGLRKMYGVDYLKGYKTHDFSKGGFKGFSSKEDVEKSIRLQRAVMRGIALGYTPYIGASGYAINKGIEKLKGGKKSMKKTAAIYRMPKPRLPSPNSVVYGRRGSASKRLVKKPRRGAKPKVPNFMKGIVGFKQLPTYKPMKSPMTKYLKKRFKF